jgi:hypothetical protein
MGRGKRRRKMKNCHAGKECGGGVCHSLDWLSCWHR